MIFVALTSALIPLSNFHRKFHLAIREADACDHALLLLLLVFRYMRLHHTTHMHLYFTAGFNSPFDVLANECSSYCNCSAIGSPTQDGGWHVARASAYGLVARVLCICMFYLILIVALARSISAIKFPNFSKYRAENASFKDSISCHNVFTLCVN